MTRLEDNKASTSSEVGHSLIWAALMIASSLLIEDEKAASAMLFLLLAGWAGSISLSGGFKQSKACERAFFRRIFGLEKTPK